MWRRNNLCEEEISRLLEENDEDVEDNEKSSSDEDHVENDSVIEDIRVD